MKKLEFSFYSKSKLDKDYNPIETLLLTCNYDPVERVEHDLELFFVQDGKKQHKLSEDFDVINSDIVDLISRQVDWHQVWHDTVEINNTHIENE